MKKADLPSIDFPAIRRANPLAEVVARYLPLNANGQTNCPFHAERNSSFTVYREHFYCYGCGARGDVIDFLLRMTGAPISTVLDMLRGREWSERPALTRHAAHRRDPVKTFDTRHYEHRRAGTPSAAIWRHAATIPPLTVATCQRFGAALWGRESFGYPMYDDEGRICGVRVRRDGGGKTSEPGSRSGMFTPHPTREGDALFIAEGLTDAMMLDQLGYRAIGRPSCNTGALLIRNYCESAGVRRAVIVADNDPPGIAGAEKLAVILTSVCEAVTMWTPPDPGDDFRSFILGSHGNAAIFTERFHDSENAAPAAS